MASSLEDLLNIKGAVAAGEFGLDGSLVNYQASVGFRTSSLRLPRIHCGGHPGVQLCLPSPSLS